MFAPVMPMLSGHRQVIGVDLQGHGRTPLGKRPISLEAMGADMGKLVSELGYKQVDVLGYSMGGGVALQMARGEAVVQDVETLSEQARGALDMIVEATASAATGAQRIAMTSREQELEFSKLSERVRRIAQISWRNRDGAEQVTASARDQAAALRGLEGATHELRSVAIYLEDLTRRITSVR